MLFFIWTWFLYTIFITFLLDCSLSNVVISVTANWLQKLIRRSWFGRLCCLYFKRQTKFLYLTKPFLFVIWWFGFFVKFAGLFSSTHVKSEAVKVFRGSHLKRLAASEMCHLGEVTVCFACDTEPSRLSHPSWNMVSISLFCSRRQKTLCGHAQ